MAPIDDLFGRLAEAKKSWAETYDVLRRADYDTSAPRAALGGASVEILNQQIILVFEILESLRPATDSEQSTPVLAARANALRTQIDQFKTYAEQAFSQLNSYWRDGISVRDGNGNFQLEFSDGSNLIGSVDVSGTFVELNHFVGDLLIQIGSLLPLCKADAVGDLGERARELAEIVRETKVSQREAQRQAQAAKQSAEGAQESETNAQEFLSKAKPIYSDLQALQAEASGKVSSVSSLVEQIRTIGSNADTLGQQVTAYQSQFDVFQSELDNRLSGFREFEANVKVTEEKNAARDAEIDRLIGKADTMIRGATTAGLSKSLDENKEAYGKRLANARWGFLLSILFLSVSAIPLAAHMIPGLLGGWIPAVSPQAENMYVGVVGKILLLLPATWLTAFFAKAYSEYFHLEREYSHKAALAKAIEGFKREAPKYQEEITARVFEEILSNPSSRKGPEPANHPLGELVQRVGQPFAKDQGSKQGKTPG